MTNTVTMYVGDIRDVMAQLPDNYADLIVTSPPFLALRSYLPADHPDKHREIGSEPTPAAFLDTLYGLSADWGRLLPEWGSLCVELGDTMSGSGGSGGDYNTNGLREGQPKVRTARLGPKERELRPPADGWPMTKSMCLLPHAYTMGLAYGHNPLTGMPSPAGRWRIRNVITWARPNPPVGSLGKRNPHTRTGDQKFRPACSFITVACRGTGRYFDLDAVRTEVLHPNQSATGAAGTRTGKGHDSRSGLGDYQYGSTVRDISLNPAGAPPLDWHADHLDGDWLWKLATAPYPGSHYATYPLTLPKRLIAAMCPARVCRECGWPSERETEHCRTVRSDKNGYSVSAQPGGSRLHSSKGGTGFEVTRETTGWTDCGCSSPCPSVSPVTKMRCRLDAGHADMHTAGGISGWTGERASHYRPGHVLDPFGGSGTTAVAAALQGVNATLIDLDHRNITLVERRLRDVARIEHTEHNGNTTTWTVTPLPPSQLAADIAGQLDLFAEGW